MVKLTILCHPLTPVAPAELENWLSKQLDRLRSSASLIVHLSQLTQGRKIAAGWLIEMELNDESDPLDRDELFEVLTDLLTDMRFLGMQPMLLLPHEFSALWAVLSMEETPVNGLVLDYPGLQGPSG
jgi:hypothetical protein